MRSNSIPDFVSGNKSRTELAESSIIDRRASIPHELQIEMKIVNAKQSKPEDFPGMMGRLNVRQSLSAVTAACMLISRACLDEVGQFDETAFRVAYNDVDFCLKLLDAGGQRRIAGVDLGQPSAGLVDRSRGTAEMGVELGGQVRELVAAGLEPAEVLGGRLQVEASAIAQARLGRVELGVVEHPEC